MKRFVGILLASAGVLASGCASVAGGNVQKMYVQAQAQDGSSVEAADCVLSNDKGQWRLKSPGDTSVVRSNKPMEVRCEKAPLPHGVVSVESGTRAALFGNILIGGVVGAVIDHSSGAAYEYPEQVRVTLGLMKTQPWVSQGLSPPQQAPASGAKPASHSQAGVAARPPAAMQPVVATLAPPTAAPPSVAATPPRIASGYAALDDVDAVPFLNDRGRDAYAAYLTRPTPKAFAIAPNGHWFSAWGLKPGDASLPVEPAERALAGCARTAHVPCKLYAVNRSVVWVKEAR